jgi:hypothetical protein
VGRAHLEQVPAQAPGVSFLERLILPQVFQKL